MPPESHSPTKKEDINKRLNAMKFRLSAKKIEANLLFHDIMESENSRLKEPLEIIRETLKKQQADDGSIN